MCLLIVAHRVHPDAPLVVAANRDEWLARPSSPFGVLRAAEPRVLGGRDQVAGGTWLATNENGVVAGLTNRPVRTGRDDSKRSRGELPLILAARGRAADAAAAFDLAPVEFNPCWLLVGDRDALFYIDMTAGDAPAVERLAPGITVLENRALGESSPKAESVTTALDGLAAWRGATLVERLAAVLASHVVPDRARAGERTDDWKPVELEAACVHAGSYGTRSSTIVVVPPRGLPEVHHTDGPPCTTPFVAAGHHWQTQKGARGGIPR